ncbi:MAG: tRNA pseudouridine synthase A [Flavipsychrobacter sp.]
MRSEKEEMARYFLEVMYDGTAFHGSQLQGSLPTVQLAVNQGLSTLFRTEIETFGASRTDEGVHALSSFYHFDTELEPYPNLLYKLNAILPDALTAKALYRANNPELNARFDATSRQYRYRIYNKKNPFLQKRALYHPYKVNHGLLHEMAAILKEYHDFESFSKRNTQTHTFKCNIMQSRWEEHGEELHYVVEANRFLRGMVRGLVATQLHLSGAHKDGNDLRAILEAKDCTKAYFNVTGNGLYLEKINYPEGALTEITDSLPTK